MMLHYYTLNTVLSCIAVRYDMSVPKELHRGFPEPARFLLLRHGDDLQLRHCCSHLNLDRTDIKPLS